VASINGRSVEGESKIPSRTRPSARCFLKPDGAQVETPKRRRPFLTGRAHRDRPRLPLHLYPSEPACGRHGRGDQGIACAEVLVCNLASQQGETDGYDVTDYLRVIHEHVGSNLFDFVLVNSNHAHLPTGGPDTGHLPVRGRGPTSRGAIHRGGCRQRSRAFPSRPDKLGPHDHEEGSGRRRRTMGARHRDTVFDDAGGRPRRRTKPSIASTT